MAKVMTDLRVSKNKLQLAMAGKCMNPYELCGLANITYSTYRRMTTVGGCKIATLGRVARALEVDVTELLEEEQKGENHE